MMGTLKKLSDCGIRVELKGERIRLVYSSPPPSEVINEVTQFRDEIRAFLLYPFMKEAIQDLGEICPLDLWDCMPQEMLDRIRRFDRARIKSVADVHHWRDEWKVIFAEVRSRRAKDVSRGEQNVS